MRSGFVSIVGRPNVGKSTLINKLVNSKVAITSNKAGTTRTNILGIYNDSDTQIVFVDTPGIGKSLTKLDEILNKKAYSSFENDLVLLVIDIASSFGVNDEKILKNLNNDNKDIILVLNKVDKISKEELFKKIMDLKDKVDVLEIVPVSSLNSNNLDCLIEVIKKYLKDDVKYFDDDMITDQSEKFMVCELIREKVLMLTKEEVPHSVTCVVDAMDFKKNSVSIMATIVVDRDNLKGIIIGKHGSMLKEIGSLARVDIENFLNKNVYLELYVKVINNWKNKESSLIDLGIDDIND